VALQHPGADVGAALHLPLIDMRGVAEHYQLVGKPVRLVTVAASVADKDIGHVLRLRRATVFGKRDDCMISTLSQGVQARRLGPADMAASVGLDVVQTAVSSRLDRPRNDRLRRSAGILARRREGLKCAESGRRARPTGRSREDFPPL
jgi:hypothetical protein